MAAHENRSHAPQPAPLLLQQPTLSRTHIAFVYGGDLWIVAREGGEARRLTAGDGTVVGPAFSPDGAQIAFSGKYDGNWDIYLVPSSGGVPRRLTYHPGGNTVLGWMPDGTQFVFRSNRVSDRRAPRLFTMPLAGGLPTELPVPAGWEAAFSPDGSRLAYLPRLPFPRFQVWKGYRGGLASPIWLLRLDDSSVEEIPRTGANDFNPIWVGDQIYFLSDRDGPVTLFLYDTTTKQVSRVLENDGLDLKWASAGPGAIVYEQFGALHLFDLESGRSQPVPIRVAADLPGVRPRIKKVADRITAARLSPTGARALFEARGEIFTVPAEKGEPRNLTQTPGVAERDPAWSPDGKWIAYFSDESGEYALHLRDPRGRKGIEKIPLGEPPSFYYAPLWSPDSRKIAYSDARLTLWYVDLDGKVPIRVDDDLSGLSRSLAFPAWFDPAWSPDSRWLVYTRQLENRMRALYLYELATRERAQLTDGMSDVGCPAFDPDGDHLYFMASTDVGPTLSRFEMSGYGRAVTRSVYALLLRQDLPSPVAPESDEEKELEGEEPTSDEKVDRPSGKGEAAAKKRVPLRIDVESIAERIVALPVPARNYTAMMAGKTGILFLLEGTPTLPGGDDHTLHRFDLASRRTEKLLEGVQHFALSHNGEKMLVRQGERWAILATTQAPKPVEGALKLDSLELRVDPRAEWRQIYHEVWRIQRDFFYDPGYHGLDLRATEKRFEPYLDGLASREDLNTLLREMLSHLCVGHVFVHGGDVPEGERVKVGLLGADYRVENGRYRFARIYRGDTWNAAIQGPLAQPGRKVATGEYLLAVDGRELRPPDNLYSFFEGLAGKSVLLQVGPEPDGTGSREVTVVPVEDDWALRDFAWTEENRRTVDALSGGRIGYVYLPNTYLDGLSSFNRYYFAQSDKEGLVIDERFNGGGAVPDHIIYYLNRSLLNRWATRVGEPFSIPFAAILGPKAMLINEYAGSGGDNLPWLFRRAGIGPLVGKRTLGWEVGCCGSPALIDGGGVTAPNLAFFNPEGEWEIENHGVDPDIEVEFEPHAFRAGRDPQLEAAVAWVLQELERNPAPKTERPPYPNHYLQG